MATYQKPQIVAGGGTVGGAAFRGGGGAYEALKAHKIATVVINGKTALVPPHAVAMFGSTLVTEEATRDDAYCAE